MRRGRRDDLAEDLVLYEERGILRGEQRLMQHRPLGQQARVDTLAEIGVSATHRACGYRLMAGIDDRRPVVALALERIGRDRGTSGARRRDHGLPVGIHALGVEPRKTLEHRAPPVAAALERAKELQPFAPDRLPRQPAEHRHRAVFQENRRAFRCHGLGGCREAHRRLDLRPPIPRAEHLRRHTRRGNGREEGQHRLSGRTLGQTRELGHDRAHQFGVKGVRDVQGLRADPARCEPL